MAPSRLRLLLRLSIVGLLLTTALVVAYEVVWPGQVTASLEGKLPAGAASATTAAESGPAAPSLESFAALWKRPLRRPLYDPPAAARPKAAATKQAPPLDAVLVGTIIEPGHSRAVFSNAAGEIEFRAVGELVSSAAAEILSIERTAVQLRHQGQVVTLTPVEVAPAVRGQPRGEPEL